ncbi:MAG TPA: S1C family serine protease [Candidatus Paceibacterota bacterium]|nr:S1C family serine protease [Candidatus Paceibacterota bacterium]
MTRRIGLALLLLTLIPASVHAAWWNPFTWKTPAAPVASTTAPVATGISGSRVAPTVEELQQRIADLEVQLRDAVARADLAEGNAAKAIASIAAQSKPVAAPAVANASLSDSEVAAKVRPSIVLIETATSTAVGAIIDSSGRIVTDARIWVKDQAGITPLTVTLSTGVKKSAKLVGIDEIRGVALIQITTAGSYPYLKAVYESGLSAGDAAYVAGYGAPIVKASVYKKTADGLELIADAKPQDNGNVIVTAKGDVAGIPSKFSCRVLEEGTHCLKYTLNASAIQATMAKVALGMRLFIRKEYSSPIEQDVRGQLDGVYQGVKTSGAVEYAIAAASGPNNFDNFNSKLGQDEDGKMTKLYLQKMKQIAEAMVSGADFLKNQTYNLRTFLIDHSAAIGELGSYQIKVAKDIQALNSAKLAEYSAKLDLLTKKKNDYDARIASQAGTTHDYLMEEGSFLEGMSDYFRAEQKTLLSAFSGEYVSIF